MAIPEKLIAGIDRLDPLPVTMRRLMDALGDENVPFQEIVEIVEHDQAVAANVLRTANSAFLGGQYEITSLRSAVIRLGLDLLLEIALGGHLRNLATSAPMYGLTEDDLWLHSAAAARAVDQIIQASDNDSIPRGASIAALVHDVGKLIMVRFLDADVRTIQGLCEQKGLAFVEAEREMFGCDHAEVGAAVARAWEFPEPIVEAIARHHEVPLVDPTPMLDAVSLANFIAKTAGVGLGAEGMNMKVDPQWLHRLGLDFERFCCACAETAAGAEELRKLAA